MSTIRKTAPMVSLAVKEYLSEIGADIKSVNINLVKEKIFTDKKEYTVEIAKKFISEPRRYSTEESDIDFAVSVLEKLMSLMLFRNYSIERIKEKDHIILKIVTQGKDGLLIGKNGQNLLSLQYLLSMILDKNLKKHVPVIIDVDTYREKRRQYLRNMCRSFLDRLSDEEPEVITEFLPAYERKFIHEELTGTENLSTFSVGRGAYKKVVITSLL